MLCIQIGDEVIVHDSLTDCPGSLCSMHAYVYDIAGSLGHGVALEHMHADTFQSIDAACQVDIHIQAYLLMSRLRHDVLQRGHLLWPRRDSVMHDLRVKWHNVLNEDDSGCREGSCGAPLEKTQLH